MVYEHGNSARYCGWTEIWQADGDCLFNGFECQNKRLALERYSFFSFERSNSSVFCQTRREVSLVFCSPFLFSFFMPFFQSIVDHHTASEGFMQFYRKVTHPFLFVGLSMSFFSRKSNSEAGVPRTGFGWFRPFLEVWALFFTSRWSIISSKWVSFFSLLSSFWMFFLSL